MMHASMAKTACCLCFNTKEMVEHTTVEPPTSGHAGDQTFVR